MIERVRIRNFAIIDNLEVEFSPGFNVITGETGAGKSVVVESLSFLFGCRFSFKDLAKDVSVEAVFKKDGERILVSRVYDRSGRSRYFINSRQVPYAEIERLKEGFIDFHMQMEAFSLFNESYQLSLIDRYASLEEEVKRFTELFRKREEILSQISMLNISKTEKEKLIEIKSFQIDELEKASLKDGEDIEIAQKIANYKNRAKISSILSYLYDAIVSDNGIADIIDRCLKRSEELMDLGDFEEINQKFQLISQEIALLKEILAEKNEKYSFEEDIDSLIARDELIKRLKRKYEVSDIKGLLLKLEELKKELSYLNSVDVSLETLERELKDVEAEMEIKAAYFTKVRKKAALELSKKILSVLKEMELKNSNFEIILNQLPDFRSSGKDSVEFVFRANPDQPLKPIKYVASGGEISRIMIAIKKVFSGVDKPSVMVLDEIDTGIGGNTAFKVAKIIKEISGKTQVICITHLPQIAVFADEHIKITKEINNGKTSLRLSKLISETDRVDELARMFGSEYSKRTAQEHALELLRKVQR